ncbi:Sugar phosphate permease [Bradyrhizobium sp. Ghvi]|uniref:MFS transporter n=1 Tax=Bradyrhizobium sp. Ghvi TaxID=1855319 RepID=UPI0008E19DA9|nr:MFS transporter [Bradyrhizobium sp. Ghvi]SFO94650.1 Sugar phosphate permease [Bradyrhizobium sp. Ghvi]
MGEEAGRSKTGSDDAIYRKVTLYLMPLLITCYTVSYLDRINISFAKPHMMGDLGLNEAVYGLGAGLFFLGYAASEVPSNLLMHRFGPRRWLSRILMTWGLISMGMMLVWSEYSFYIFRIALGIGEAGLFPGVIFYLMRWYPTERRATVTSLFYLAAPLAGIFGAPISGLIIAHMHGTASLAGWQWMFLLEGLPAVLLAFVVWFKLSDTIEGASWLSSSEKVRLRANIDAENVRKPEMGIIDVFKNVDVLLLAAILFGIVLAQSGIFFYLPSLIKGAGVTDTVQLGIYSAVPYAGAVIVMLAVGRNSDRKRERFLHFVGSCLFGVAGFLISVWFKHNLVLVLIGLSMALGGVMAVLPVFWSLPTAALKDVSAAAGIAFINSIGLTAGFFAPFIIGFLTQSTNTLDLGIYCVAGIWTACVAVSVVYFTRQKSRSAPATVGASAGAAR